MNSKSLPERLKSAVATPTRSAIIAASDARNPLAETSYGLAWHEAFVAGICYQDARLQPIVQAMIECSVLLDKYAADYSKHDCECGICYTCRFRSALSRLEQALGEG